MNDIYKINDYLKKLLEPKEISDVAINGIQVENDGEIKRIAFAVDASIASIEKAIKEDCNLLIVHHGLFWGKVNPITLNYRKRIKLLLENNIGLIAFHLPLDCNSECGNNAQILKRIGVSDLVSFGYYKGFPIGFMGEFDNSLDIDQICNKLGLLLHGIKYLNFGTKEIKKIAVVSGGGGSCFDEAIQKKVDLFITGDAEHTLYHMAAENKINLLFAGHYFTETFGIKAIQKKIEEEFNIYTIFCDIPTGL